SPSTGRCNTQSLEKFMDIRLSPEQQAIAQAVTKLCAGFGDDYWSDCVTGAAIMMHAIGQGGGGYAAASSVHLNIFGPHAIVVHGTDEQKRRMLVPLIKGEEKACFGVTEPNAGLDTTSIETFARRTNDGYIVRGRKIWTTTAQEADRILLLTRTARKQDGRKPTDGMTLFYTHL